MPTNVIDKHVGNVYAYYSKQRRLSILCQINRVMGFKKREREREANNLCVMRVYMLFNELSLDQKHDDISLQ